MNFYGFTDDENDENDENVLNKIRICDTCNEYIVVRHVVKPCKLCKIGNGVYVTDFNRKCGCLLICSSEKCFNINQKKYIDKLLDNMNWIP